MFLISLISVEKDNCIILIVLKHSSVRFPYKDVYLRLEIIPNNYVNKNIF